jgi:hypothetical protein
LNIEGFKPEIKINWIKVQQIRKRWYYLIIGFKKTEYDSTFEV